MSIGDEPAFPVPECIDADGDAIPAQLQGFTKRELFVLVMGVEHRRTNPRSTSKSVALAAQHDADALLAALEQESDR